MNASKKIPIFVTKFSGQERKVSIYRVQRDMGRVLKAVVLIVLKEAVM